MHGWRVKSFLGLIWAGGELYLGGVNVPLLPSLWSFSGSPCLFGFQILSSFPCCRPEELMKQSLEDVFLFLHRVLSRRSMAASVIVLPFEAQSCSALLQVLKTPSLAAPRSARAGGSR